MVLSIDIVSFLLNSVCSMCLQIRIENYQKHKQRSKRWNTLKDLEKKLLKRLLLIFSFVLFELILNFQNYHAVPDRILRILFLTNFRSFFLVFNFVMIDYNLFTYLRENIFILFYKPLFTYLWLSLVILIWIFISYMYTVIMFGLNYRAGSRFICWFCIFNLNLFLFFWKKP